MVYILGAQKNRLIATLLLITNTMCLVENINLKCIYPFLFIVIITVLINSQLPKEIAMKLIPNFLDIKVWSNSADPHQTVPKEAVYSGSSLFAVLSISLFGIIL